MREHFGRDSHLGDEYHLAPPILMKKPGIDTGRRRNQNSSQLNATLPRFFGACGGQVAPSGPITSFALGVCNSSRVKGCCE